MSFALHFSIFVQLRTKIWVFSYRIKLIRTLANANVESLSIKIGSKEDLLGVEWGAYHWDLIKVEVLKNKTSHNKLMIVILACEGTENWLHKALLPSYSKCIKVEGNLGIYNQTFTGWVGFYSLSQAWLSRRKWGNCYWN